MMGLKRYLFDKEQWSQSSGFSVIPRLARPGLAGLKPHKEERKSVSGDTTPCGMTEVTL
jgi:hypothetical protein